jgi:hypothetical protein
MVKTTNQFRLRTCQNKVRRFFWFPGFLEVLVGFCVSAVMTNIAIEHTSFVVDLPIENGDFP